MTAEPVEEPIYHSNPPARCNLCNKPFGSVMFDARTRLGSSAVMCDPCFDEYGIQLGQGFGRKYELQADGRWLKILG